MSTHPVRLALLACLGSVAPAYAQCGQWDVGIGVPGIAGPGNPKVYASALFDDGTGAKIYAAGGFASAGGVAVNNIACWDGTSWSALGLGVDAPVLALAVFDDGQGPKLYVGGQFVNAGGAPAKGLASWDGTNWAEVGGGVNAGAQVFSLAVGPMGTGGTPLLYVGGNFSSLGGVNTKNIGAWNGTQWLTLGTSITSGGVWGIEPWDPDGPGPSGTNLYVAGGFNSAGGVAAAKIACWDGTNWSALGTGLTGGGVTGLVVKHFDDGGGDQLYVGGTFLNAGGASAINVARWDGSTWSAAGAGLNGFVETLEVHDDGNGTRLYAGGGFGLSGTQPATHIARWDGASWSQLGVGVDTPGSPEVRTLTSASDAQGPVLFAGGLWHKVDSLPAEHVALWRGTSVGVTYCTSKVTSGGCVPAMDSTGSPSLSNAGGFAITASQLRPNVNGLLFFSTAGPQGAAFQGGFLCVKSPYYRTPVHNTGGSGSCAGSLAYTLANLAAHVSGGPSIVVGARVDCQAWFRDPQSPSTTGLSNGLQFYVCP